MLCVVRLASYPQLLRRLWRLHMRIIMITGVPWIYILRCADDSFYVGSARDLEYRLEQHVIGCADSYTITRRPLALAWAQECEHIGDAYMLERKIKGWRREKKIALIEGRYRDLPQLSLTGSHKGGSTKES